MAWTLLAYIWLRNMDDHASASGKPLLSVAGRGTFQLQVSVDDKPSFVHPFPVKSELANPGQTEACSLTFFKHGLGVYAGSEALGQSLPQSP